MLGTGTAPNPHLDLGRGWSKPGHLGAARIVVDPRRAVRLAQGTRTSGDVEIEEFTLNRSSVGRLTTTLLAGISDYRVATWLRKPEAGRTPHGG